MSRHKRQQTQANQASPPQPEPPAASDTADQDSPYPPKQHEIYLEERKAYHAAAELYAGRFDKWMVTLAGGALGVSMAFVKDLIKPNPPVGSLCLFAAWICFGLSTVVSLLCTLLCQRVNEEYGDDLDQAFRENGPDPLKRAAELQGKRSGPNWITWLNRLNMLVFLAGVVLAGWFVRLNLDRMGGK